MISEIAGIGPVTVAQLSRLGVDTADDLLMLKPKSYRDKISIVNFSSVMEKGTVNTFCRVISKSVLPSNVLKVIVEDAADHAYPLGSPARRAILWCFGRMFLSKVLVTGNYYHVYGSAVRKPEYGHTLSLSQFEVRKAAEDGNGNFRSRDFGKFEPVYSVSDAGLDGRIKLALDMVLRDLDFSREDFGVGPDVCEKYGLAPPSKAFRMFHMPSCPEDIEAGRRTLAMIEIMEFRKDSPDSCDERVTLGELPASEMDFVSSLPFSLTSSQMRSALDVLSDLESPGPSERILQGEVGSGKTIIAFLAAHHEVLKGRQCAIVAPTEILALQHYMKATARFGGTGVKVGFLTSSSADRAKVLSGLASGEIGLLIGTHAVFGKDVKFFRLSFAVIDEEQRFGVVQKKKILEKGKNVKLLYMSATPIPGSILKMLSARLLCSSIDEVPSGRAVVKTRLVSQNRRHEAYELIKPEFKKGHCAYFVVPRIDDEGEELKSIKALDAELSVIFGDIPHACVNSRTKNSEREDILKGFLKGELKYLIATSVVEVGMDNPLATVIVIEDADMFGLSVLHQLRGRVGRSSLPSWCFLVYRDEMTESGLLRLKAIRESNDGFELAERDFDMRGGGDLMGTRQSGRQSLRHFDPSKDQDLLL